MSSPTGTLKRNRWPSAVARYCSMLAEKSLSGVLKSALGALDFSLLLPDVMTIADEVDSQLPQAMEGYMDVAGQPAAA